MTTNKPELVATSSLRDELELKTLRAAAMGDTEVFESGLAELKRLKETTPQLALVLATQP